LDFFKSKGHLIVKSAPMVVKDDPTLMFTNAGMNQFKDSFLGNKTAQNSRIADTQKCLRVSGKHNDLEEVGIDTYHHTMFEMLGNWSFGDYFKKEAIGWAWELLTGEFGLPKDRLYASVFGGDEADGLKSDEAAFAFWNEILPEDRILYGSKKDNFWEMGETGPCGPCSEVHIDLRSKEEVEKVSGRDLVNMDHPLVVEIWNLVFIQFNRLASGKLENLPEKHVDTGMGFERLAMAIQNKKSNYDTDVFQPLIQKVSSIAGIRYGENEKTDIAIRVVSDHVRAVSFAIADGQLPSNVKAGYVIRRILRRAVRYGFTFLNQTDPFIYQLVDVMAEQFDDVFPEIREQQDFIKKVIEEEESSFLKTLEVGLKRLEQIRKQQDKETNVIDGKVVFELYDTFGFPVDLTALIARENGLEIDETGFEKEMSIQKNRSRQASEQETSDWNIIQDVDNVEFMGYDQLEVESQIVKYREVSEKKNRYFQVVLDRTPFYAESGGQVGDRGYLESDGEKIEVFDTKKENELIVHFTKKLPADPKAALKCTVDANKRRLTENNHSATHLMHAALREVLGTHVQQKGSLVNESGLRFDFSHFSKMSHEEIRKVEHIVNSKIRENITRNVKDAIPIEDAKSMGAMALFGEKYGNEVRVVTFDKDYSIELCGGCHVSATGEIGIFRIISESSVAAGVRRIEAVTAEKVEEYMDSQQDTLEDLSLVLKNPKDMLKAVQTLVDEKNDLQKEMDELMKEKAGMLRETLKSSVQQKDGVNIIIQKVSVSDSSVLKDISFQLRQQIDNLFMVIAADVKGKPQIFVMISDDLVKEKNLNAGNIVRELAKEINGGGGGQPFFATAGGSNPGGIDKVLIKAQDYL